MIISVLKRCGYHQCILLNNNINFKLEEQLGQARSGLTNSST